MAFPRLSNDNTAPCGRRDSVGVGVGLSPNRGAPTPRTGSIPNARERTSAVALAVVRSLLISWSRCVLLHSRISYIICVVAPLLLKACSTGAVQCHEPFSLCFRNASRPLGVFNRDRMTKLLSPSPARCQRVISLPCGARRLA